MSSASSRPWLALALASGVWLLPRPALAHVGFSAPPPNTQLVAGTDTNLEWLDLIAHTTTGYTLEFYASTAAPAVLITAALGPTTHSYVWQVPQTPCASCFVRVTQVNDGGDYSADLPIAIITSPATDHSGAGSSTESEANSGMQCALADGARRDTPVPTLLAIGAVGWALWRRRR